LYNRLHREPDIELTGDANSFSEVLEKLKSLSSNVALIDLSYGSEENGLGLISELNKKFSSTKTLVLLIMMKWITRKMF